MASIERGGVSAPEPNGATGQVSPEKQTAVASARSRLNDLLPKKFDIRSMALTGLFILSIFYTMYFMRAVLLPLVLALLLSYLLRPLVRSLARFKIPPPLSAALLLAGLLAAIGYGAYSLSAPAAGWLEKAPYSLHQLQSKLYPLKKPMEQMQKASGEIDKITNPAGESRTKPAVEVKTHPIASMLFVRTPEVITGAVLLLILLYFLLSNDGVFLNKLISLMPTLSDKKRAVSIANEIEGQVSRYLFTQTLINLGLGCTIAVIVGFLGLPNPMMWGVMAALFNFVPYLGALTGIVCITLGAVLTFDSFGHALIFPAIYLALATLEGNFITPYVMGRSLTLNPVIILLSLIFWGWLWGIPGIILAVPVLAAFKIFCAHVEPLEPFAEFLS
jgi:predicted PurR-regulated permease PerM